MPYTQERQTQNKYSEKYILKYSQKKIFYEYWLENLR